MKYNPLTMMMEDASDYLSDARKIDCLRDEVTPKSTKAELVSSAKYYLGMYEGHENSFSDALTDRNATYRQQARKEKQQLKSFVAKYK